MNIFRASPEANAENLIKDVESFIGKFNSASVELSSAITKNDTKIAELQSKNDGLLSYKKKLEKMSKKLNDFFKEEE